MEEKKSRIVSQLVFAFTFAIVILNVVSLIFPALLVTSFIGSESDVNSFEFGAWTVPFLSINISILVFGLLYYKRHLPKVVTKSLKFVLNFEVSPKTTVIVFSIIVGIYITFTVGELDQPEGDKWGDWDTLELIIEKFPSMDEGSRGLRIQLMKNFLLFSSQEIFQNVKILPFIGSISLIFLIYFLTRQISGKRFAGLVAMTILLQSHTFLRYDTTATYSNFWTAFYLFSLYLIYKKWPFSSLAFLASVFSKALSIVFIPMTLFFALRAKILTKVKIRIIISYIIIFAAGIVMLFFIEGQGYGRSITPFELDDFVSGLTAWAIQLRIDGVVLVFLLPLTIGLYLKSRKGVIEADSIMVMIAGILLSVPLLAGFSYFNIQPYRWIPLIAFFAIGVGILLSKTSTNRSEN